MIADVGRKPDAYRSIHSLFIIGLIGLILAACGVSWLLVAYAQISAPLAQRAAMYRGSWAVKQEPYFAIPRIEITSNGLNITMHVSGNCHESSNLPCDLGTHTQTFTGKEPLTTLLEFTYSNGTHGIWLLAINLSNTDNSELQVVINNTDNGLFDKT